MEAVITTILTVSIAFMLAVAPVFAASTEDPVIQEREVNQERRTDQGVKRGELTTKEAGRFDAREAKIQQDEERMKSDGNLTNKEHAKLTKEQNKTGKKIYKKKHNDKKADVGEGK